MPENARSAAMISTRVVTNRRPSPTLGGSRLNCMERRAGGAGVACPPRMATTTFPRPTRIAEAPTEQASRDPQLEAVTHDVFRLKTWIVNCFFIGEPGGKDFVLVDTGMPTWGDTIA